MFLYSHVDVSLVYGVIMAPLVIQAAEDSYACFRAEEDGPLEASIVS